jgi:hypothetical protein
MITREQAVAYRLHVNHLVERLPAGSHEEAAYVGLQDTAPRDALLGLHARMAGCVPSDWEHPTLIQTYSPRAAVYVLPVRDFGVFTVGRLPLDAEAVRRIDVPAEKVCAILDGGERRGGMGRDLREACASGRIVGAWGRIGGRVSVVLSEPLRATEYDALEEEVATMPVRDPQLSVS